MELDKLLEEKILSFKNFEYFDKADLEKVEKFLIENLNFVRKLKKKIYKEYEKMKDLEKFYDKVEHLVVRYGVDTSDLGQGKSYGILIKSKDLNEEMKEALKALNLYSDDGEYLIEVSFAYADDMAPVITITNTQNSNIYQLVIPHTNIEKTLLYKENKFKEKDFPYLRNLNSYEVIKESYLDYLEKKEALNSFFNNLSLLFEKKNKKAPRL